MTRRRNNWHDHILKAFWHEKRELVVPKQIAACAAVTQEGSEFLSPIFARAYPVDETHCFGDLLRAMDQADQAAEQKQDWRWPMIQEADAAHSVPMASPTFLSANDNICE
ncbi:hypothetical protein U1700_06070 [Sphingomonas sp. RB1R13]